MEAAIVGDEQFTQKKICSYIRSQRPECRMEIFARGEDLLAAGRRFDLVFLDIQLEGINGIETAQIYRQRQEDTVLVFFADTQEYVLQAFDVSAFHYLLKPIEERKFMEVFDRAVKEVGKHRGQRAEIILIREKYRSFTIDKNDILYIENRGKKVEIHMVGSEELIEIYATMEELTRKLGDGFYRCHRGYLVNMAYITEYDSDSITLSGDETVCLSKKKHSEFVRLYMYYHQKEGGNVV